MKGSKKHLEKFLSFLMESPDFGHLINGQQGIIKQAYSKLRGSSGNWKLEIPQIEIRIQGPKYNSHCPSILIGGTIKGKDEEIIDQKLSACISFQDKKPERKQVKGHINIDSCCLNAYGDGDWRRIIRRFHFDFQPEKKPTYHVQYGGIFKEEDHLGKCHYCLESFFEEPRIHYFPMDLVLIFDLFIRQFDTELSKLINKDEWKGFVRKSQKIWLKDYCNNLSYLSNKDTGQTIIENLYC
jgi:hypothetical protein